MMYKRRPGSCVLQVEMIMNANPTSNIDSIGTRKRIERTFGTTFLNQASSLTSS